MQDEVHKLRELLFDANKLTERLSAAVSDKRISGELAPLVDATRHAVLTAMRCAHALELAGNLVETREVA